MESFFLSFPPPETKSDRRRCGSGGERTATMAEDCCRLENEARFHFESPAFRQQKKNPHPRKKKETGRSVSDNNTKKKQRRTQ